MMIPVSLGARSYRIAITDSYQQLPNWLKLLDLPREGWVVSHQSVLKAYGPHVLRPLQRASWTLHTLTVPESESSKSLRVAQQLIERLSRQATMRMPVLFAFGGGVVGDLTGFIAAVFRRGVPYVQLPTTLLAQVDSAIGGKVGVDLPQAKNMVGAFYQPRLVCNNVALLHSLPRRQRQSGLAEVIKYGVIADRTLFEFLEEHLQDCLSLSPHAVRTMVSRSCAIKARVVSCDERETRGQRIQLNFGHTLGHALEAATHYRRWTHGEAIAIGMCAAADLSCAMRLLPKADARRIHTLIQQAGLPTHARGMSSQTVRVALRYDKKFTHGRPRWVLPQRIGRVVVREDVPERLVSRTLARCLR